MASSNFVVLFMMTLWLMASMAAADGHGGRVPQMAMVIDQIGMVVGNVYRPTIGNWLVDGRDVRNDIPTMPRSGEIGMRIVMCTLVLIVAFRRAFPNMGENAAIAMGVLAESILRGVQPHSDDVQSSVELVEPAWQDTMERLGTNRNEYFRFHLQAARNARNDPEAVQAVPMNEITPILRYLDDYARNGVNGNAPFPDFLFNPWE